MASICEICDRPTASDSDWNRSEAEGLHLCWGSNSCLANAVDWRSEALRLKKRCAKLEGSLRVATNALRAQQAETLRSKVKAASSGTVMMPGLDHISKNFDRARARDRNALRDEEPSKKASPLEDELSVHRELLKLFASGLGLGTSRSVPGQELLWDSQDLERASVLLSMIQNGEDED